jgi:hypothetical protein
MVLKIAHEQSVSWMVKSNQLLDGVDFKTSNRSVVSVSLLHLSIEHQKAIGVLVGCGNVNGSAFALLRPQFEAYVRGLWYNRCASDKQIQKFLSGGEPPRINKLIEAVEETDGFKHGALMRQKKSLWTALNDYTHGGSVQVKARTTGSEITGNYSLEHLAWLLNKSSDLSLLAGIEIVGIANNNELANELLSIYREIYPTAP